MQNTRDMMNAWNQRQDDMIQKRRDYHARMEAERIHASKESVIQRAKEAARLEAKYAAEDAIDDAAKDAAKAASAPPRKLTPQELAKARAKARVDQVTARHAYFRKCVLENNVHGRIGWTYERYLQNEKDEEVEAQETERRLFLQRREALYMASRKAAGLPKQQERLEWQPYHLE